MSPQSIVLTDLSAGVYVDSWQCRASSELRLAGAADWSVAKRRLRGGPSDGVDVVDINNGALSVSVLPTRGMGLWRGSFRGLELGWKSPVAQPVHPSLVDANDRGGLGWLAGFNEWLCRCGLASFGPPGVDRIKDANGDVVAEWPLTLHGKIANIPAHRVAVEIDPAGQGLLRLVGEVDETTMFGPRLRLKSTLETVAGSNSLSIVDEVTNLASQPGELMMLYHINVGKPFLEGGSQLLHPARTVTPRDANAAKDLDRWETYLPPTPGYREQCYFLEPLADDRGRALAFLKNAAGTCGMAVRYETRGLPWFTVWKNTIGENDGYCTGIEPGTGFPNLRTFEREQGRVVKLAPGETHVMRLEISVCDARESVAAMEREIAELQRRAAKVVEPAPNPKWTSM